MHNSQRIERILTDFRFAICHLPFSRSSHVGFHTNEDEKDFLNGFNGI